MKVLLTPQAQADVKALPMTIRTRMLGLMDRLDRWPNVSGAKPLRGKLAGKYRIRTGDYRVQFRVVGETVIVERMGHRDRFYE